MSKLNRILFVCVIIAGCYTQKTALKHLEKAKLKEPGVTSKFVADNYPPGVSKIDTITNVDTGYIMVPVYNTDTIHLTKNEIVKVDKIKVVTKTVTITKSIVDSARVNDLMHQLSLCKADKDKIKDKGNNLMFWLFVALCVS
jgi:hypothetical protein